MSEGLPPDGADTFSETVSDFYQNILLRDQDYNVQLDMYNYHARRNGTGSDQRRDPTTQIARKQQQRKGKRTGGEGQALPAVAESARQCLEQLGHEQEQQTGRRSRRD